MHYPYFRIDSHKQIVLNMIKQCKESFDVKIEAYSIQMNHFHLLYYSTHSDTVTKVKTVLHSGISREFNKRFKLKSKFKWQSTRTFWIKDDDMFWGVQGYIIGNLLKHREVDNFHDLYADAFSSFSYISDKYGREFAENIVRNVIFIEENAQGVVELDDFKTAPMGSVE